MFLSVFDLFKVGIGPSSSHTVGPMVAMGRFLNDLAASGKAAEVARAVVTLYGSLAYTGKGHGTDRACVLGLLGERPDEIDPADVNKLVDNVIATGTLTRGPLAETAFDFERDIIFDFDAPLEEHTNGMLVAAYDASGNPILSDTYFSVGGGFVVTKAEFADFAGAGVTYPDVPYPFRDAAEMLEMGRVSGKTVAEMKFENEISQRDEAEVRTALDRIWSVMKDCMDRGIATDGQLPGGLKVKRRARQISDTLAAEQSRNVKYAHAVMDWISLYAIAVNEENAAGGRIVTAPTNGAAGVIPATIRYYLEFCPDASEDTVDDFLLTAAAIGGIIKTKASISGAEVGCQGEVGSAAAMAAAGLCAVLGGTNAQIENAAEIAIEHHLGMTCDPVAGLVQVPCIERNAMGAVKAVNAASLALLGDGTHFVPLDSAIETMRQTGVDMLSKYKETSQGGLAVNVTEC
ncbi:MAG: L-serine ammonia-lyase [Rhodospirillales bacterium]|nr:L-serine ammonia-lyase [Rhodospirillales bacterium]MBO6788714.1 L-serine ammonia-lyase [Rhodospirillales bacterium]